MDHPPAATTNPSCREVVPLATTLTALALSVLLEQHGVIAARQLLSCGVSAHQRTRLVDAGTLVPLHKGVYRVASSPSTLFSSSVAMSTLR